jgi:hydrogenase/urease accessory protein HupE
MSKRIALLLCLVSPMASAHVGHHGGGGFLDGLRHQLLGLDHLLGTLMVTAGLIALAAVSTVGVEPQRSRWFRVAGIGFVLSGAVLWLG